MKAGDNVVVDELHYETEFVLYRHLQDTKGVEFRIAKHRDGRVDIKDFEALVNRRTRLVSVAWVSHHNGFRHEMRPIADLAHSVGAIFYADAIQAAGMIPIDVKAVGVDVLCAGTYKWMLGGFGVAPFYVRRDLLERIRLDRYGALHVERALGDAAFELPDGQAFDTRRCRLPRSISWEPGSILGARWRDRIERHTVGLAHQLADGLARAWLWAVLTPAGNRSAIRGLPRIRPT